MLQPEDVSAFHAKTHLSELLRETEHGRSFTIRRRGKPVARLVPAKEKNNLSEIRELFTAFREIRDRVRGHVSIRRLIDEGRRA
ncbi:MAG: type II toxin-antitoxin system prevent-host-death family antitoxin [Elusimicrobia bacterium]|nr:type II toxin-antitoxin system prevent-host-death family antitoxin [Elusimicrobiota bacterium]